MKMKKQKKSISAIKSLTRISCFLEDSKFNFFNIYNPELRCVSAKHFRASVSQKLMHDPDWYIEHDDSIDIPEISSDVEDKQLTEEELELIKEDVRMLSRLLKTTPEETLFFVAAYSVQLSQNCLDNNEIANFLDISRIEFLHFSAIKDSLLKKGLIRYKECRFSKDEFLVSSTAERCVLENRPFKKQKSAQTDRYKFCKNIALLINERENDNLLSRELFMMVEEEEEKNRHLKLIQEVKKLLPDIEDRTIFYEICNCYINNRERQVYIDPMLSNLYDSNHRRFSIEKSMMSGEHFLLQANLIELLPTQFISDASATLADKGKQLFLEEDYELLCDESCKDVRLISPESIPERNLFFYEKLDKDLTFLQECLAQERLKEIQNRLKGNGMSTGINVLFYGLPGTGKTASAEMIAKATGRSVYHVDIAASKSCWFGQSEKIFKKIFEDYREMSKREKLKPILLFNEADALFGKRKSVDIGNLAQTENTLQNILLEEMEKLDGILIATTNLCDNLDSAFDRRFLFKIRFGQPTVQAKQAIWKSKLSWLTDEMCERLAKNHDLSGGEIENIARKCVMEKVLNGDDPTEEMLDLWCRAEKLNKGDKAIGFTC